MAFFKKRFKEVDYGYDDFKKSIMQKGASAVKVGIVGESGSYDPEQGQEALTVAQVASFMEFGTATAPERPFMRLAILNNSEEIAKLAKVLTAKVLTGEMSREKAMGVLGEFVKSKMVQSIDSNIPPPNEPSTIRAKGGKNKPLINTGQLRSSIDWELDE